MACYWRNQQDMKIDIPVTEEINTVIYYKLYISISDIQWTVLRRYSDFYRLHCQLVTDHGLPKDILPPKKVIRNKCPVFIEARREALANYLQYILVYLKQTMPKSFLEFLCLEDYDIFYLLKNLATHFYYEADKILSSSKSYLFNPLQLFAISDCLKNPFHQIPQSEHCFDISHVLDFCSQLCKIVIQGVEKYLNSNIRMNILPIEFSAFKSLEILEVEEFDLENVNSLGNLRKTVKKLSVHKTGITNISHILQCDVLHRDSMDNKQIWKMVTVIDFSSNRLKSIDESIKLVPNLNTLILNNNEITEINNLSTLLNLKNLYISNNLITSCLHIHTEIKNISTLDLSQNYITSLEGLSELLALENLILSSNKITVVDTISTIGLLPCLDNVVLTGNPVSTSIDYRIKVLEFFREKSAEICLDNEKPSQHEIDKIGILRALKIVKDGRTPYLNSMK